MKRKFFKILNLISVMSLVFISCGEKNTNSETITSRSISFVNEQMELRDELVFYSMTENYKLTEEAVTNDIKSFLALKLVDETEGNFDFSRAIDFVEKKTDITKMKTVVKNLPKYNISSRNVNSTDDVNISFYEITEQADTVKTIALTSDDERIGSLLCIMENVDYNLDVENPILEIYLTNIDEYIETVSNEIESITEDDYEFFKEKYNITDEKIKQAKADYENAQNARKFWGYDNWSSWSVCDTNLNNFISKTKWGQWSPYNNAIKAMENQNYPTGCGTTAVAQIMAYHEWPLSYKRNDLDTLKNKWTFAAAWDGNYNWKEMTADSNADNLSVEGKICVGALMYEISKGCDSVYNTNGTSTTMANRIKFLRNNGYTCDNAKNYSYNSISASLNAMDLSQ